jgi:hypothetical protein
MKKFLALLLFLPTLAAAGGIRLPNGKLIVEGDPFSKLSQLGRAVAERSYQTTDPETGRNTVAYEYHYPEGGGYNIVTVINGKIAAINWTR